MTNLTKNFGKWEINRRNEPCNSVKNNSSTCKEFDQMANGDESILSPRTMQEVIDKTELNRDSFVNNFLRLARLSLTSLNYVLSSWWQTTSCVFAEKHSHDYLNNTRIIKQNIINKQIRFYVMLGKLLQADKVRLHSNAPAVLSDPCKRLFEIEYLLSRSFHDHSTFSPSYWFECSKSCVTGIIGLNTALPVICLPWISIFNYKRILK
ncbi:hypothetical protein EGR_00798 [Echinococcus granulosus]|uniref:Uncharacterized protein n=1 Tax=Echinococcus granulosus TaxID=6210 RepID=W6VBN7_ECHGR|nr:hypothetical protein EGR_00798 [Echinococcus granulosus]EUB64254.1 hypothetical protein EGR_00798 [Echinococcus granulosus]